MTVVYRISPDNSYFKRVLAYIRSLPQDTLDGIFRYRVHGTLIHNSKDDDSIQPFIPPEGKFSVPFKDTKIEVFLKDYEPVKYDRESFTPIQYLQITGDSEEILKDFLDTARIYFDENILNTIKDRKKIVIQFWDEYWNTLCKRPPRPLDTLYFEDMFVKGLTDKIDRFIGAEDKYLKLGLPYKMNILLDGYPGTGKTSLIFGIASHFKKKIAILNFNSKLDDTELMRALKRIPENSILVLEDIDGLFKERKEHDSLKNGLTFSGLLNSLDGFGYCHQLIIFMTTNYKCNLDSALIRPGRVDYNLHFGYATKNQIKKMFHNFFPEEENQKYFAPFWDKVKRKNLTTAIVQQFFLAYMDQPEKLSDNVEEIETVDYAGTQDGLYS